MGNNDVWDNGGKKEYILIALSGSEETKACSFN